MAPMTMQERYQAARDRLMERRLARNQDEARQREAADQAARDAKARKMEIAAQKERDKLQNKLQQAQIAQRAAYDADAALAQFNYQEALQKREIKAQKSRDKLQQRFEVLQGRRQRSDQAARDQRLFQQSQQEDATQFQNQLQRDAIQQGYSQANDRLQNEATLRRDAAQAGYGMLENRQQQQLNLGRDAMQAQQQRQRDELLNRFDQQRSQQQFDQQLQRDSLQEKYSQEAAQQQFQNQMQRDWTQNQFETASDFRQQGFRQQNMYQQEAADISAQWQEQITAARNSGLDFSERQRKEMQEMDASFRKNVLNGPYDEVTKQRAMVEHNKRLSAIVPEERVQSPQDQFNQSLVYNPKTGQQMMSVRDPHGFMRFEPLDDGTAGMEAQRQRQEQQQQQEAQKRQDAMIKAGFERQDRFAEIENSVRGEINPNSPLDEPMYKDEKSIMQEALRRFQPYDSLYQAGYGLAPFAPYGQQEQQTKPEQQPKQTGNGNPYRQQEPQQTRIRPEDLPPLIVSEKPLPKEMAALLKTYPGGEKLHQIREKFSQDDPNHQTLRYAADVVIHAILTGDTSNVDYQEALMLMERAGFNPGN